MVCKRFSQTASGHLKALELGSAKLEEHPTTTFTQFSGLTRLQVSAHKGSDLRLFAHPRIAPVVTHARLWQSSSSGGEIIDELAHLALLPKLRSLVVNRVDGDLNDIGLLPDGLEELMIHAPYAWWHDKEGLSDTSPLTRFSKLTSLGIGIGEGASQSVQSLANLRNLRSLYLGNFSAVGVLSTLTMLTSLTWVLNSDQNRGPIFNDLGRMTWLSGLQVGSRFSRVTREDLECVAKLTGLTSLRMYYCSLPQGVTASSALSPLTRLVCLGFDLSFNGLPLLAGVNLGNLQSLKLWFVKGETSVLRYATMLTHLKLHCYDPVSLRGLGATLRRMSDLRSLGLSVTVKPATKSFRLSHALQPLTRLTKLDYNGHFGVDSDLRACGSLPSLRSLMLRAPTVTPVCLPALQAMSGLRQLALWSIRKADVSPDDVAEAFDAERLRRGWPRLRLYWG